MKEFNIDLFLRLMKIGSWTTGIGFFSVGLTILTILVSKKLRFHPGWIILGLCFSELYMYYGSFWMMQRMLVDRGGFDLFLHIGNNIPLGISPPLLFEITSCTVSAVLEVSMLYYMFISLDVVFLIRNPFYSPQRRVIMYHVVAIILPFITFLPIRYHDEGKTIFHNISLPINHKWAQYIDMIIASMVFLSCIFSLFFFLFRMRKMTIPRPQKRAFLLKMTSYTIVGTLYSSLSFAEDVCMCRLADTGNYNWLTAYVGCSLGISVAGIALLPIRIAEPAILRYLYMRLGELLCLRMNKHVSQKILVDLEKSKSYYSFVHTSLNGELAESILRGISELAKQHSQSTNHTIKKKKLRLNKTTYLSKKEYIVPPNLKLNNDRTFSNILEFNLHEEMKIQEEEEVLVESSQIAFTNYLQSISITHYVPNLFQKIRDHFGILDENILDSVDPVKNRSNIFSIGEGEGKSGSFFIFTSDKKLLIKTTSPQEMKLLVRLLPNYTKRVTNKSKSMIAKIFGAYSVKMPGLVPVYFILMENSLPPIEGYKLKYIFDLKGSLFKRYIPPPYKALKTLKDVNFLQLKAQKQFLEFNSYDIKRLKNSLYRDINFLKKFNIMDYSLLLGICKRNEYLSDKIPRQYGTEKFILSKSGKYIYFMTVIDYLQEYNYNKRIEHSLKAIRNPKYIINISAIPTKPYANRFINFIHDRIWGIQIY